MAEDLQDLVRKARAIGNGGQQQAGGEPMVSLNGQPTPVSVAIFAMLVDVRDTLVRIERMGGEPAMMTLPSGWGEGGTETVPSEPEGVSGADTGPDDGAMGAQGDG